MKQHISIILKLIIIIGILSILRLDLKAADYFWGPGTDDDVWESGTSWNIVGLFPNSSSDTAIFGNSTDDEGDGHYIDLIGTVTLKNMLFLNAIDALVNDSYFIDLHLAGGIGSDPVADPGGTIFFQTDDLISLTSAIINSDLQDNDEIKIINTNIVLGNTLVVQNDVDAPVGVSPLPGAILSNFTLYLGYYSGTTSTSPIYIEQEDVTGLGTNKTIQLNFQDLQFNGLGDTIVASQILGFGDIFINGDFLGGGGMVELYSGKNDVTSMSSHFGNTFVFGGVLALDLNRPGAAIATDVLGGIGVDGNSDGLGTSGYDPLDGGVVLAANNSIIMTQWYDQIGDNTAVQLENTARLYIAHPGTTTTLSSKTNGLPSISKGYAETIGTLVMLNDSKVIFGTSSNTLLFSSGSAVVKPDAGYSIIGGALNNVNSLSPFLGKVQLEFVNATQTIGNVTDPNILRFFDITDPAGTLEITAQIVADAKAAYRYYQTGLVSTQATQTGLLKVGAGVLRLSNDNTYTGVTVVNGGTLALSALKPGGVLGFDWQALGGTPVLDITSANLSPVAPALVLGGGNGVAFTTDSTVLLEQANQINDAATLFLNGGELNINNFNETMSSLTLVSTSIIDMGLIAPKQAKPTVLNFTGGGIIVPGSYLVIQNWEVSGMYSGAGGDINQIFFSPGSLDAAFLDNVYWEGFNGGTLGAVQLLSGEIVPIIVTPIPEPSTYIIGALITLIMGYDIYRRIKRREEAMA